MPVSRAQDTPQNGTLLKLQSDCRQLSFLYYKKTAFKSILAGTFKNCIAYNRSPLNTNLVYHGIVRFVKHNFFKINPVPIFSGTGRVLTSSVHFNVVGAF